MARSSIWEKSLSYRGEYGCNVNWNGAAVGGCWMSVRSLTARQVGGNSEGWIRGEEGTARGRSVLPETRPQSPGSENNWEPTYTRRVVYGR